MAGKEYRTITDVKGPLVFLNKTNPSPTARSSRCASPKGHQERPVLDTPTTWSSCRCSKAPPRSTAAGVTFAGDVFKLSVSTDLVGRILDAPVVLVTAPRSSRTRRPTSSAAINPYSRQSPHDFIQTGISAIDCCTRCARPEAADFLRVGLPHNDIALRIAVSEAQGQR